MSAVWSPETWCGTPTERTLFGVEGDRIHAAVRRPPRPGRDRRLGGRRRGSDAGGQGVCPRICARRSASCSTSRRAARACSRTSSAGRDRCLAGRRATASGCAQGVILVAPPDHHLAIERQPRPPHGRPARERPPAFDRRSVPLGRGGARQPRRRGRAVRDPRRRIGRSGRDQGERRRHDRPGSRRMRCTPGCRPARSRTWRSTRSCRRAGREYDRGDGQGRGPASRGAPDDPEPDPPHGEQVNAGWPERGGVLTERAEASVLGGSAASGRRTPTKSISSLRARAPREREPAGHHARGAARVRQGDPRVRLHGLQALDDPAARRQANGGRRRRALRRLPRLSRAARRGVRRAVQHAADQHHRLLPRSPDVGVPGHGGRPAAARRTRPEAADPGLVRGLRVGRGALHASRWCSRA